MPAQWTWVAADANRTPLCELATVTGRSITYRRDQYTEATGSLSHEDDAAGLILNSYAASGPPMLLAYRKGVNDSAAICRLGGYLAVSLDDLAEQATLSLTFRSPFGRLVGDGQSSGRYTTDLSTVPFVATDQGAIAKALIDTTNADGPTGLVTQDSYAATKLRDRTYQYQNVGQAIMDLSSLLDGFDFDETYDASGLATFNVYGQQGSDRSSTVKFQYGAETMSNVREVQRTTTPPCNRVTVLGANGLTSVFDDVPSQARYGLWPVLQSASDVSEQSTLDDKARALIRPNPVKTISFAPELGLESCPRYFDDFGMGDTVNFHGRRGAFVESVDVRVNAAIVAIDDAGFETVEVPDPTDPEGDAVARALLQVEVTS